MASPPTHGAANGGNFTGQTHLTLTSSSIFPSQPAGQALRAPGLGLERLGLPDGLHGPSQQGSSSNAPQQGKMKSGHPHGKKTKGRVKIKMEFIDNKLRRYTTFSKRKAGLMKKAYELSTLTGTEVMLLVASETGHVYTFATRKLQPMIASEDGKKLIQTCLNSNLPNGCESGMEEPIEHRMNLGTGYDEEAGDDEDEYFDEDGDSSNGSPQPNSGAGAPQRFHNSNTSNTSNTSGLQVDSQGQYSQAEYMAAGDAYSLSSYPSSGIYDPELKTTNGQDALLGSYEGENNTGNFTSPGGGMGDLSRR